MIMRPVKKPCLAVLGVALGELEQLDVGRVAAQLLGEQPVEPVRRSASSMARPSSRLTRRSSPIPPWASGTTRTGAGGRPALELGQRARGRSSRSSGRAELAPPWRAAPPSAAPPKPKLRLRSSRTTWCRPLTWQMLTARSRTRRSRSRCRGPISRTEAEPPRKLAVARPSASKVSASSQRSTSSDVVQVGAGLDVEAVLGFDGHAGWRACARARSCGRTERRR